MTEKLPIQDGAGEEANERVDVNRMHAPIYREHNEPQDGYEPPPTFWLICMLALALGGGFYMGKYSGDFSKDSLDGSPLIIAGMDKAPPAKPLDPKVLGKRVFNNCMACHQADGKGVPTQFPPLAGSEWVLGSPRVLARILLHGVHEEIEVLGKRYNAGMPAWARFSDEQIAAVLTYIRSDFGNNAPAIEPTLIAAEREATRSQRGPWTATELRAVKDPA